MLSPSSMQGWRRHDRDLIPCEVNVVDEVLENVDRTECGFSECASGVGELSSGSSKGYGYRLVSEYSAMKKQMECARSSAGVRRRICRTTWKFGTSDISESYWLCPRRNRKKYHHRYAKEIFCSQAISSESPECRSTNSSHVETQVGCIGPLGVGR